MTQRQKIIVISAIAATVVIIGLLIFFFGVRKPAQTETPTNKFPTEDLTGNLFETDTPARIKETEAPATHYLYNKNSLYYTDISGILWKKQLSSTGENGGLTRVGEFTLGNVHSFAASNDGKHMLIGEGAINAQKRFSLFNTATNETIALSGGIREAIFLNDNELVYYKESIGETGIFIYSITNKRERLVKRFGPLDARISPISPNILLIAERPIHDVIGTVLTLNLQTGTLNNYFSNFLGATLYPLGQGKVLAFAQNPPDEDNNKPYNLIVLNQGGTITHIFDIVTMPEKCVMDRAGIYLYCAIPLEWSKNMPQLSLPDDYYKQGTDFTEKFYRIDLITFVADEITPNAAIQDAIFPTLNEEESKLYFHDRKTEHVYSLTLPPIQ